MKIFKELSLKLRKRKILYIIKEEYKKYQWLINNETEIKPEIKLLILAKRDAIVELMDKIEKANKKAKHKINYA